MNPAAALFDPHGIPWKIEVHHRIGELQIPSFAARSGGEQDICVIAEPGDRGILLRMGKIAAEQCVGHAITLANLRKIIECGQKLGAVPSRAI